MTDPGSLVLASRWARSEQRKREAVRAAHERDVEALIELLEYHLKLKSARRSLGSADTRRLYALGLRRFLEFTDKTNERFELTRLEPEVVEAWLVSLEQEGLAIGSATAYLHGVRALYRALQWAGAIANNPASEVRAPKDPTPAHARKSALSIESYKELIALPISRHGDEPRTKRDQLMLMLGGGAGLRVAEICGLEVSDLELRLARLTVRAGKGGKRRVVPLASSLIKCAEAWFEARAALVVAGEIAEDEQALLVSLSRNSSSGKRLRPDGARYIAAQYYRALGLPPEMWGMHTLRRTAGTHLYRATRDLHVVADVLGHANVSTSAIYAKMDMDVRREALEAMESMRSVGKAQED